MIKFVIFVAQRPPPNIVILTVRVKFTRILSDSVHCWRLLGNEDVLRAETDSSLWKVWLLIVSSGVHYSLQLNNFHNPKTIGYFAHLMSYVGFKMIFVAFFVDLSLLQRVRNI